MGLPSGTKWARFDIDITQPDGFCVSEFQYEKSFFSWANVQGHNPVNHSFDDVYNWGKVNAQQPWYEGQPYGETIGSQLQEDIPNDAVYDAARAILGAPWHLPSAGQFQELLSNVDFLNSDGTVMDESITNKVITLNGIVGIWMQSKINGNKLFMSCSGLGADRNWSNYGNIGYYWLQNYVNERYAYSVYVIGSVSISTANSRYNGFPIRPVQD